MNKKPLLFLIALIPLFVTTVSSQPLVLEHTLISNTDSCLTDCEMVFSIRTNKNVVITDNDQFTHRVKYDVSALPLRSSGLKLYTNVSHKLTERVYELVCKNTTYPNGTTLVNSSCYSSFKGWNNRTVYRDEWVDFNPLNKRLDAGVWYTVKLWGKRDPVVGKNNVDVIPSILGVELPYSWWNSSWDGCRNISITNPRSIARNYYPFKANLSNIVFSNAENEIRIVNSSCNTTGTEQPSQVISNTSIDVWDIFIVNVSAASTVNWSVYYDYSDALAPDYSGETNLTVYNASGTIEVFNTRLNVTIKANSGDVNIWHDEIYDSSTNTISQFFFGVIDTESQIFGSVLTTAFCNTIEEGDVYVQINCTSGVNSSWIAMYEFYDSTYFYDYSFEFAGNDNKWMMQMYSFKMEGSTGQDYANWSNGSVITGAGGWLERSTIDGWLTGYKQTSPARYGFHVWDETPVGQKAFNIDLATSSTHGIRYAFGAEGSTGVRLASGDHVARFGIKASDNASDEYVLFMNPLTYYLGDEVSAPSVDTCTYSSGDWNISCSDNCSIVAAVDLGGNDIHISGTGTFHTTVTIRGVDKVYIKGTGSSNQCVIYCVGDCFRGA